MKFIIEKKMSGTGSIHDLASENFDRVISGRGQYAVVLAAYYGGKGYTTHTSENTAIRAAKRQSKQGYSYQIIDGSGNKYDICNDKGAERLMKE